MPQKPSAVPIDRRALVSRHNVVLTAYDGERPVQVGNGEFAFGMDSTGLQTFAPFNTMSQWGWHSSALPTGQRPEDFQGQVVETHGRPIRYPLPNPRQPELSAWLAANPHRINLGRIGLALTALRLHKAICATQSRRWICGTESSPAASSWKGSPYW